MSFQNIFPNYIYRLYPCIYRYAIHGNGIYVGDVLSFYLDNQVQETFIQYARQTENLYNLAYLLGYSPKVTTAATVEVEVFQTVPSKASGIEYMPDYNYALQIAENTAITSTSNSSITFLMQDKIDFSYSNALDPTTVTIYEVNGSGEPTSYLLKKEKKSNFCYN